jgi:hypothetical protein
VRLINHSFLLGITDDISESRSIYTAIESLLAGDYHYWLQRRSLEVEAGDLSRAELFLNQARSLAPEDYKVDTEYGYLLMRKAIADPQGKKSQAWIVRHAVTGRCHRHTGRFRLLSVYVLGSQGLAWARRARTTEERRRILHYFQNVVEQGTRKHPLRRDLDQLRKAIQRDLLMTTTGAPDSPGSL